MATKKPTATQEKQQENKEHIEQNGNGSQSEVDDVLNILEPNTEPKIWIIGKPPEHGGEPSEYAKYVQKSLSYHAKLKFISLITRTIARAVREGGAPDLFGADSMAGLGGGFSVQDIQDSESFMSMAMRLISYSEDFLLDCYCIWLDIPPTEQPWAKAIMSQRYAPEEDKWGLTDEQGIEMIEVFIDQNHEELRDFFLKKLKKIYQRIVDREQALRSATAQSTQSKPTQPTTRKA